MANVKAGSGDSVFSVKKWLGVNEAQEGDAALKSGEAAVMRNFKVTSGGALMKRAGSKNVVELTQNYNVEVYPEKYTETEYGESSKELTLYPRITADGDGNMTLEGSEAAVNFNNAEMFKYYYGTYPLDGITNYWRFEGCKFTGRVKGDSVDYRFLGDTSYTSMASVIWAWFCVYDSVIWNGSGWVFQNPQIVNINSRGIFNGTKYMVLDSDGIPISIFAVTANAPEEADFAASYNTEGRFGTVKMQEGADWYIDIGGTSPRVWDMSITVTEYSEAKYDWSFSRLYTAENPSENTEVKALWSGFVGGRQVLCAAGNGHLWELSGSGDQWEKASCGEIDTSESVHLFGFDEKLYILNGSQYKVWDGTLLTDVEGYRPLVSVAVVPTGGGTSLEQINKLNGLRRCWISPDGEAVTFTLPESGLESIDWVKDLSTGEYLTDYTCDTEAGTVTFGSAPARGVNTIEIAWTYPVNFREQVTAMRYSELFNGSQDSRVFIYGDGGNKAFYSGLDYDGNARADYFPDLNECAVGAANTPITAMIRHYNRLLCFKLDSTWSIYYDSITLTDGTVTAGFYITPVNRDIGNCAYGEARLVENRPRTLDGRSVIEWRATSSSGNITGDERNAQRVSQRVDSTIRTFDLSGAKTFYDKITHEYYVIGSGGETLVNNVDADVWYIYTGFDARCMINYKDEVYYGTSDGFLRHFSENYLSDNGQAIDACWESGAMDFSKDFKRKYSAMIWIGIKPEENGYLAITCETDRKSEFAEYTVSKDSSGDVPEMKMVKLKAKKFTYYKLIFENCTSDKRATVVSADVRVRSTGYVR